MARVNVYLPDDLADAAREAGLNVSSLTQAAIRRELRQSLTLEWIDAVLELPSTGISHAAALEALDAARDEFSTPRG